jgi:nucleotide-binding universal stress UspA family protein
MKVHCPLVPLDGSPLGEAALTKVVELVTDNAEAALILLRAAEAATLPGLDATDAQVAVVREAEEYLERVATAVREKGVARVRTSVWYGGAVWAMVDAASMADADVIVMSTHGRSALGRLVLGSVAGSVAPHDEHAHRPGAAGPSDTGAPARDRGHP